MALAAREGDLLSFRIEVRYPKWMNNLDDEEFDNIISKAESDLIVFLSNEIYKAEQYWRARKMVSMSGQTDIYDYVQT